MMGYDTYLIQKFLFPGCRVFFDCYYLGYYFILTFLSITLWKEFKSYMN